MSCLFVITAVAILSCVPPVSRDALTHHLAVPKLWLAQGAVCEIPAISFSYYPMNLDLLYAVPLYFGNDILPKFIHFSFSLLTAWLMFSYLRKRLDIFYALLGVFFFLSLPVIIKLSISVYVDLGLIFFSFASLVCLFKWIEKEFHLRFLILSAIFCGLALGTKYNGLILLFLLSFFVPYISSSNLSQPASKSVGYGVIFFIMAILIFSPWMIKNYLWTNNPLFPLYDKWFNPVYADTANHISHFILRSINYDESWWEIALIPVRIFFQGADGSPRLFDGKLNPLLFLFPFFAFLPLRTGDSSIGYKEAVQRYQIEKKILLAFSILFLLIAFFKADMRIRYVAPIIPPIVILAVFGLHNTLTFFKLRCSAKVGKTGAWGVCMMVILLSSMNLAYIWEQFKYVDPIPYIKGQITRDAYIEKYCREYPALRFANENLPGNSKILGFFMGNRLYYSDREMIFDIALFQEAAKKTDLPENIVSALDKKNITHLLIRYDLFNVWIRDNFDSDARQEIKILFKKHLTLLFSRGGYGLFQVESGR